jgi:hypothetical protein
VLLKKQDNRYEVLLKREEARKADLETMMQYVTEMNNALQQINKSENTQAVNLSDEINNLIRDYQQHGPEVVHEETAEEKYKKTFDSLNKLFDEYKSPNNMPKLATKTDKLFDEYKSPNNTPKLATKIDKLESLSAGIEKARKEDNLTYQRIMDQWSDMFEGVKPDPIRVAELKKARKEDELVYQRISDQWNDMFDTPEPDPISVADIINLVTPLAGILMIVAWFVFMVEAKNTPGVQREKKVYK